MAEAAQDDSFKAPSYLNEEDQDGESKPTAGLDVSGCLGMCRQTLSPPG
jgi:hypothetical protein